MDTELWNANTVSVGQSVAGHLLVLCLAQQARVDVRVKLGRCTET